MPIDLEAFKDVLSRFPSGVTLVTTLHRGRPHGCTVTAFCSVSAEPPLVLVCLGRSTESKPLIDASRRFAVHILSREQVALAERFAGIPVKLADAFEGVSWDSAVTGAPILPACVAWLDCEVSNIFAAGDHAVVVGHVLASGSDPQREPVLYQQRAWRALSPDPLR